MADFLLAAGNKSIEIFEKFHSSAQYFPAFKESIFESPLIASLTKFLTIVVTKAKNYEGLDKNLILVYSNHKIRLYGIIV